VRCRARVKEQDSVYYSDETQHYHPLSTGMTEGFKVKALIKLDAKNQPFASATQLSTQLSMAASRPAIF